MLAYLEEYLFSHGVSASIRAKASSKSNIKRILSAEFFSVLIMTGAKRCLSKLKRKSFRKFFFLVYSVKNASRILVDY